MVQINITMYRSNRIIYLNEKFSDLTRNKLYVNALTKQLSPQYFKRYNRIFSSLLESCMFCGSATTRKNKFYNAVGFQKSWKGVTIFQDDSIDESCFEGKSDFNVALLIEAKQIKPISYHKVIELQEHFDLILTYAFT